MHNRWILFVALSALTGAVSGLYDKFIMARLDAVFVQSWYNLYQFLMMAVVVAVVWWPHRHTTTPFRWNWAIPLISVFLSLADFAYLYALRDPEAMISVVSMIRRGSVVVSFVCGAALFSRTQSACESGRFGFHPGRYGFSVDRLPIRRSGGMQTRDILKFAWIPDGHIRKKCYLCSILWIKCLRYEYFV